MVKSEGSCTAGLGEGAALPECLESPSGSSFGSLEALGVAHPTKNDIQGKTNKQWSRQMLQILKTSPKVLPVLPFSCQQKNVVYDPIALGREVAQKNGQGLCDNTVMHLRANSLYICTLKATTCSVLSFYIIHHVAVISAVMR